LPYQRPSAQVSRIIEILDHEGGASGEAYAEWVSLYINGGIPALEKLEVFAPYFVFVAEQSSQDLDTLLQWAANFSPERDIPQLILLRAYRRLTGNPNVSPDDLYGSFFEAFIKRLAALRWPFSQRYDETWILVRRLPALPPPDTSDAEALEEVLSEEQSYAPPDLPLHIYLILILIEKTEVEASLRLVMNDIPPDKSLSRDQTQAVNSVKSNFFNSF
jgi:hypothetical protein